MPSKYKPPKVAEGHLDPLEYLAEVMNDEKNTPRVRIDAAKAIAPYLHPRFRAKRGWVLLHTLPSPVKSMKVYKDRLYVCTAEGVWTYDSECSPPETEGGTP